MGHPKPPRRKRPRSFWTHLKRMRATQAQSRKMRTTMGPRHTQQAKPSQDARRSAEGEDDAHNRRQEGVCMMTKMGLGSMATGSFWIQTHEHSCVCFGGNSLTR